MLFKYHIKFDEEGEIGCFCKNIPSSCYDNCDEYVVKLIPVKRDEIKDGLDNFKRSTEKLSEQTDKLTSEIKKVSGKLRRSFK